ncbi:hypothetical protein AB0B15_11960 [Streptomyces sp. NPDC045456]|uniref:hypothetical protein n=1 Tax=Streptomyces sp. NPDC045456 TaxID=3155254 RepID=UPI0033CD3FF1
MTFPGRALDLLQAKGRAAADPGAASWPDRLAQDLDQGAPRLLALSARPAFAPGTDPIVLFRRAGALRRLGRYAEGLAAIDRALDRLPPAETAAHADLVRERSLLCAARDLHQSLPSRTFGGTPT